MLLAPPLSFGFPVLQQPLAFFSAAARLRELRAAQRQIERELRDTLAAHVESEVEPLFPVGRPPVADDLFDERHVNRHRFSHSPPPLPWLLPPQIAPDTG